ncbi:hypothetical protein M501DRAFT_1055652 [Patellaria atrata CBS 101060]|uniref:Uncharacterized protein n=1 Tax=Patellaria atrata CBS 101060 TaxID=1346257 RepID=A0A9P4SFN1_9PEZI|nr:hypothetical protein M501DRAFT_1055652 [Patellaria atrata CBS 101060]
MFGSNTCSETASKSAPIRHQIRLKLVLGYGSDTAQIRLQRRVLDSAQTSAQIRQSEVESIYAESIYAESIYAESIYAESIYAEFIYAESIYAESIYAESIYAESIQAESIQAESLTESTVPGIYSPVANARLPLDQA